MIRFRDLSIKTKLVSIQLFTTLFVLLVFIGIYMAGQYKQFEDSSFTRMSTLAEILGSNSVSALLFFDNTAAEEVLESLATQSDILSAIIYDHEGKVFAVYNKSDAHSLAPVEILKESKITDKNHFLYTKRILLDNLKVGWITLAIDSTTRKSQFIKVVGQSFFVFSIGLLLAGLLSIRAQKPISDSILTLANTTQKVHESGDYSLRVTSDSKDEVGALVVNFNAMMEKISHNEKHLEDLVTERTLELEVAKTKAEESDHLKSAFLASMSHELRTPLNSIIGFTGIILQGMAGPLTDEQKKQLNMVKGSASHLLDLINDVLDISKIESGRLRVIGERFKIDSMLIMTISALRPFAEKKGLTMTYELDPNIPELYSDKRRIGQVLINLINNAIKFTEEGNINIVCKNKEGTLVIDIIDTGIGIKDEDQEFVFKTFRQVDSGLNRIKEGSGLGLAICKRLTELLGGTISLKSQIGIGSTFSVVLPLRFDEEPGNV